MKTIIITIGILINSYNHQIAEEINTIEDNIEWLNEDLFNGNISEENYELILSDYNKELKELKELTK
tara:strand:+ start:186 stop:386 length:201 start_codon:yes stop_codon:yes gene_type:complete